MKKPTYCSKLITLNLNIKSGLPFLYLQVISSSITAIPNLSHDWPIRVAEATLNSKSGVLLKLDRSYTFQNTLTKHLSHGTKVFYHESGKPVPPVLILSACRCKAGSNNVNLEKRNQLRCELVAHHLKSVCKLFG